MIYLNGEWNVEA